MNAHHKKCDRYWYYREDVVLHINHTIVCHRCTDTMNGIVSANDIRKHA